MRRLKTALLLIAATAGTFLVFVVLQMWSQRGALEARGPLTLEQISRMAAQWGDLPLDAQDPKQGAAPEADQSSAVRGDPPTDVAAGPALVRTLTQEEWDFWTEERRHNETRFGGVLSSFSEFVGTAVLCTGLSEDGAAIRYFEAANIAFYWTGDWETARRLFRQALDLPLDEADRRYTYVHLAWLEGDPEVATRLLELACPLQDERPGIIAQAARLAHLTGSRELFDHYVARLERLSPEQAAQLRTLPWPSSGQKSLHARAAN
jgi:hypothetical protein